MASRTDYILDSENECDRQELQASLQPPECILKHLPEGAGKRILDAGSGTGSASRLLAKTFPDAQATGVDTNPNYVDLARRRAAEDGLTNLAFQQGDLSDLPFEDSYFDIVWSQFVLNLVPDALQALREFRRVTKPYGSVVVRVHHIPFFQYNDPDKPELFGTLNEKVEIVLRGWKTKTLPSLFVATGLDDITVDIETDPIFTSMGKINPNRRLNFEGVFGTAFRKSAHLLGGPAEVDRLMQDLLTYYDRPDTTTITTAWTVKGIVRGN